MDLKVTLDATTEHMKERILKHVNQRLCDNLCNSVRREDLQYNALKMIEKYPLRVYDISGDLNYY